MFADGVLEALRLKSDPGGRSRQENLCNPDGSEAELSGNGAREAIVYLRRLNWTDPGRVSRSPPPPGRIRPTITGPDTCPRGHGLERASTSKDFPTGPDDGQAGHAVMSGAFFLGFSVMCRSATPNARSTWTLEAELACARPGERSARRSKAMSSSPIAPTSPRYTEIQPPDPTAGADRRARIRARIFELGWGRRCRRARVRRGRRWQICRR